MIRNFHPLLFICAGLILGLARCTPPLSFPAEAEQALRTYWAQLPSTPGLSYQIDRAWPGNLTTRDARDEFPADMEVWCIETTVQFPAEPALDGARLKWLVWRTRAHEPWQASMLAAMSSTWPSAACGE